jgi:hypothetical protein
LSGGAAESTCVEAISRGLSAKVVGTEAQVEVAGLILMRSPARERAGCSHGAGDLVAAYLKAHRDSATATVTPSTSNVIE